MRTTAKILSLVSTAALFAATALPSFAEDASPARPASAAAVAASAASAASTAGRPERGMHMDAVEARYGAPATRYPAVGQPAITRWDYPGFVVFFENDLVLHAVVVTEAG